LIFSVRNLFHYVAVPFFAAFGMGLILYGLVQGLSAPSKLCGVPVGAMILVCLCKVLRKDEWKYPLLAAKSLMIAWVLSAATWTLMSWEIHILWFFWFLAVSSIWVIPTWSLTLLPLSFWAPPTSQLWKPWVIGPLGGAIGWGSFFFSLQVPGFFGAGTLNPGYDWKTHSLFALAMGLLTGLIMSVFVSKEQTLPAVAPR
jgi:hypothetical protein